MTTGVDGLDTVLGGGLLKGRAYIIQGQPGAGKTILANQICFHHAAAGGKALYVTLLAESHARMIENLSSLAFLEPSLIPDGVYYISGQPALKEGLDSLVQLLRAEIRRHGTTLMVLDGLLNVREAAGSGLDFREFMQNLQGQADFAGCSVLMLTSTGLPMASPEHTMVDGVIELTDDLSGVRTTRHLMVTKHRGGPHLRGLHQFDIVERGVAVYPRLEARYGQPSRGDTAGTERMSSGIETLDAVLGGGLPAPSMTLVLGASGTGKTTTGLHFLARSSPMEPGLYFGFYETPPRLLSKAAAVGIDLGALVDQGAVEILWQAPTENLLDGLGHHLLEAVDRRGVRRLVIDSIGGFERAAEHPRRLLAFLTALTNELRVRGVTTVASWELRQMLGSSIEAPAVEISSLVENMVALRFVELQARVRRILAVMKIRDGAYDSQLREFEITDRGIELASAPDGAEVLLGGFAHGRDEQASR